MHGHKHTDIHTTSINAVTLVWGLLRLASNILSLMTHYITVCNCMKDSKSESKHISMGKEGSGESSLVFAGTFDCNQSDVALIYLRCKTRSRVVTDTRLQDVCYLLVSQFQSCLTLPSTWLYCCLVVATLLAQVAEQALNCLYIQTDYSGSPTCYFGSATTLVFLCGMQKFCITMSLPRTQIDPKCISHCNSHLHFRQVKDLIL